MAILFNYIYKYFTKHKVLLTLLLFITFIFGVYIISNVKFEEDITKMMPQDKNTERINTLLQNNKFTDRIIFHLYLSDTIQVIKPDSLIFYSELFTNELLNKTHNKYIKKVILKTNESSINNLYDLFLQNLPIFLENNDYNIIDSLIEEKQIQQSLEQNYKTLLSPAGFALKNFILNDPLSFTPIILNKLLTLKYDDNYDIYNNYIFTKDRKHLLFFLEPSNLPNETGENTKLISIIDETIDSICNLNNQSIKIEYFGTPAISVSNAERIKKDVILTVGIGVILLMIFITWYYRKITTFFIVFLPVIYGSLISLVIIYFIRDKISAISLGAAAVLLGVTIDYALHIFTHNSVNNTVETTINEVASPILICSFITCSAFGCLILAASPALKDFGLFALFSVASSAIVALIVIPHFLHNRKNNKYEIENGIFYNLVHRIVSIKLHENYILLIIIVIISIISFFAASSVGYDSDLTNMNYVSKKLINAENNLDKIIDYKLKNVYLVSTGNNFNEALINNEKTYKKIKELKKNGYINKYSSISKIIVSDSIQKLRISKWKKYWTSEKIKIVNLIFKKYSDKYNYHNNYSNILSNIIKKNYQSINFENNDIFRNSIFNEYYSINNNSVTIYNNIKIEQNKKDKIYSCFNNSDECIVLDKQLLTNKLIEYIKSDFNTISQLSTIILIFVLILYFGRIELGIIASLPILVSWYLTIGIMSIFNIKFNIFNITISTFVFGMGVDYSIFIMQGLIHEYTTGENNLSVYKTSIFLSSITTSIGVGVLIFAKHPALQSIAILSLIGLTSVIIVAFSIEPFLFYWLVNRRGIRRSQPITLINYLYSIYSYTYYVSLCLIIIIFGLTIFRIYPLNTKKGKELYHLLLMYISRSTMKIMFFAKKNIINFNPSNYTKPVLIISNHQSIIDIPLSLMFIPKIILITSGRVWRSPIYGHIAKISDFYTIENGIDEILPSLKEKIKDGYSILIFPEGTRSKNCEIQRFHKGAFYLAEKLNLDIVPMIIHGTGHYVQKNEILGKRATITVKFMPKIEISDLTWGCNYSDRTKSISKYFKNEFNNIANTYSNILYYKDVLIKNYIYKGPILEWYTRVKIKMENYYSFYDEIIPKNAKIIDIGCGYGYLDYMLSLVHKERKIIAIDYDENKIRNANNCLSKNTNINFVYDDALNYKYEKADVFVLNDVLHYLKPEKQEILLNKCISNLNYDGIILIRDGDTSLTKRHKGTILSEIFSTEFRFNKKVNDLFFISRDKIIDIAKKNLLDCKIIDNTKKTSNILFILKKSSD